MKNGGFDHFRRSLALLLAALMLMSDLALPAFASDVTEQESDITILETEATETPTETTEGTEATEETEAAENTEDTETTEATKETDATEATKATEDTEPTEAAKETEETEETENTEGDETPSVYEQLMAAVSIDEMYALLYESGYIYDLEAMTAEELTALDAHADAIYIPETDDAEIYEMVKDGIGTFTGAYEDHDAKVLVTPAENTIYFDLRAGDVTINENTYTGYRYDGSSTATKITGNHSDNLHYYVYQSVAGDYTKGLFDTNNDNVADDLRLPEYEPVTYNGELWGDYITNHPSRTTETAFSDTVVTDAWIEATKNTDRTATDYAIAITTTSTSTSLGFNLTIDNVWSSRFTGGVNVGLRFSPLGTNKSLSLTYKGDNRLARLHCATEGGTNGNYTQDLEHKNQMSFQSASGTNDATLTICNPDSSRNTSSSVALTYTAAAIGGTDGIDHTVRLTFNSGTIYAANGGRDFGTAIGGGGNGPGRITIKGGRITAVASSTGTAIGGGCGTSGPGGFADISIEGGSVYAYNYKPCGRSSDEYANALPTAIGGGSSGLQIGGLGIVKITDGYVYAYSEVGVAIGGGGGGDGYQYYTNESQHRHCTATGGVADVTISGGTIDAISGQGCAIGGGPGGGGDYDLYYQENGILPTDNFTAYKGKTVSANGGTCKLTISGNPTIRTGSIGGGSPLFPAGSDQNTYGFTIGAAVVNVSGGTIYGQVVMQGTIQETGGIEGLSVGQSSSFTMSGGLIDNDPSRNINKCQFVKRNGGAVFIGSGYAIMNGGTIQNGNTINGNNIDYGGGIYISGGDFTMNDGTIQNCEASNGGAVCVQGGNATITGGEIIKNTATNGGAVAVLSGNFTMSGGSVGKEENANSANLGGGVYANGGSATLSGGSVQFNTATDGAGVYVNGGSALIEQDAILRSNHATTDGGGVYVTGGSFTMTGGSIGEEGYANTAVSGGGVYVNGGTPTISGGYVQYNTATDGAGVYVNGGTPTISGGAVQYNTATDGAGVYVNGGTAIITNTGDVSSNTASNNGGGIFVNGGSAKISGGSVSHNTAAVNGGGIGVNNGKIVMSGGEVSNNTAVSGDGGGMFVSSTGTNDVAVKVYSGTVSNNTAALNGGAVAVRGETGTIEVQIGVNHAHYENGELKLPFDHTEAGEGTFTHTSCPVIQNNTSEISGGAFYISGQEAAHLYMFCLVDGNNSAKGDNNVLDEPMSDFLMVEGGTVYISTADNFDGAGSETVHPDPSGHGSMTIHGSIHVVSGKLELFGTKDNPKLESGLTIDLKKDDDFYFDHRGAEDKITISYHENFRVDGTIDSTQTAFDIEAGDTHTIYKGLYAHDGYELVGWNTDPNAELGLTEDGWYDADTEFTFQSKPDGGDAYTDFNTKTRYGDIIIYAIWKVNGYTVVYDPGVPEGEGWSGSVPSQKCDYVTTYFLPENDFDRPGYLFAGWLMPDGTVKQPADTFSKLTTANADTVTIYAQWKKCDHPDEHLVYTADDENDVMTKHCNQCGMTATATLTAKDETYDGNPHYATLEVECLEEGFWTGLEITYTGTTLEPQNPPAGWTAEPIADDKMCINAGAYVATVADAKGNSISVNYTIKKAPQPAPVSKPSYIKPESGSTLVINRIAESDRISSVSGVEAVYVVRYYEGNVQNDEEVKDNDPTIDVLEYTLKGALKTYAVLVYYPETENYLPSDMISADSTFFFGGNIYLTIKADTGIDFTYGEVEEKEMVLHVSLREGYYLLDDDFNFDKEVTSGDYDLEKLTIHRTSSENEGNFTINAEPADESTSITVTIGRALKIPSLTDSIKEKQVFSDFVADADPTIARDSAFTVRYDLVGYHTDYYQMPKLSFKPALPEKTTIILRDRLTGSYWHYEVPAGGADSVDLDAFIRMGTTKEEYPVVNGDMRLQFIVDFSRAKSLPTENALKVTFGAEKIPGMPEGVKEITSSVREVKLKDADLSITAGADQTTGLVQKVQLKTGSDGRASKYDYRDVALVLKPESMLPIDANVLVDLNESKSTWYPQANGTFIIPLGDYQNLVDEMTIRLNSNMFPMETTVYEMDAYLYLSMSDAEAAPLNGHAPAPVSLIFTSNRDDTGVKIIVSGDQRVFHIGDSISATIELLPKQLDPELYTMEVKLQWEIGSNEFTNTGTKPDQDGNTYTFPLSANPGDYCIVAKLMTKEGYELNEAKYYFILLDKPDTGE